MKTTKNKIIEFLLEGIPENPGNIVFLAMKKFSTSRVTVLRHLNRLVGEGKVFKTGKNKGVHYHITDAMDKNLSMPIEPGLEEDKVWRRYLEPELRKLPENIFQICSYGFHEIFNNAIEHSQGRKVGVITTWKQQSLSIIISDDGVGIFKKIKEAFQLADERESVLRLSQGKVTTDHHHHTGEGIFFTSKAFDEFAIQANGYAYLHKTPEDDWAFQAQEKPATKGTRVAMEIRFDSKRLLVDVFKPYTHPETKAFDRTQLVVELSKNSEASMISRSQARRLLAGADRFARITLDFSRVTSVGQGFVDEVFRVFKNSHPGIQIDYLHANEEVRFMIERGLATAAQLPKGEAL